MDSKKTRAYLTYYKFKYAFQLFSLLASSFKNSDIATLEDLIKKIDESGINPKPKVEIMDYCWDWKNYALDNLSKHELKNHSF